VRTSTGVKEELTGQKRPESFRLYQNYPNPFNGGTKIRFEMLESVESIVRISALDGRLLFERIFKNAGVYEVDWNGESDKGEALPSGVYLVSLQNAGHIESMKMTLVR